MVFLFLLAASYGRRGIACSQDSGSNMGHLWFVELQDDRRSISTLQSAVQHTQARRIKLRFHGKYEAYKFGKNGLAGSNVQTVENML